MVELKKKFCLSLLPTSSPLPAIPEATTRARTIGQNRIAVNYGRPSVGRV